MRVLQIGGIFGQTPEFRAKNLQTTTETILVDELPAHGIEVASQAHGLRNDMRGIDLVHIHHLAKSCVSLTLHKPVPMVFTRHALGWVPALQRPVLAATQRRADAQVALSDHEAHILQRGPGQGRVVRIYNGVDARIFHGIRRKAPSRATPWRLLFVGQLIPLKRSHIALEALSSLVQTGHDVHLTVVSHRPTLEPELRGLARELEIENRVRFVGALGQAAVAQEMRASHALLLTSNTESLPTVVTEALLTGLPVVAFDVGGVREQLPPGVQPVNVLDVLGYVRSVHDLLTNYYAAACTFAAHQEAVTQRFSVESMVHAHADLYRSLI